MTPVNHTNEQKFECRICLDLSETAIRLALQKALPAFQWEEGDCVWDKIRVIGTSPDAWIRIYRYEGPGPFDLTMRLKTPEAEKVYLALREKILHELGGTIWKRLEPQPVSLVKLDGQFPAAYDFDCDLEIEDIKKTYDDAEFWSWQAFQKEPLGLCLEGRVPFRVAGELNWKLKERIRITGHKPSYRIEVGKWQDAPDRKPSCEEVHLIVQNTILPAIGARNVTGART